MKDRFSQHASQYAAFRPRYPQALFDFVFSHVMSFDLAWDAGTGNGQAAQTLATRFKRVVATDISRKQLEQAAAMDNIAYEVAGETINLPDNSVDLVTVAQAIHWFDRPKFYAEVRRVSKPGALLAVWVYGLLKISEAADPLVTAFYTRVIGPYWDPERKLVDEQLKTMEFPFEEIPAPRFTMSFQWTLEGLEGYLRTWSATQKFLLAKQTDPVPGLMASLREVHSEETLPVSFPLFLRVGKV